MVLAKDITNPNDASGMTLCGKGVTLTDSLIRRLEQMGIQSIIVEGHPVKIEGEATLEEMLADLDKRFSRVLDDPLMVKIKGMYERHIKRSMGEEP